jgi:hypothetical protein
MKRFWQPILGALLVATVPAAAAAQDDAAAELAEAHEIIAIMYPAAERDQMVRTMIEQFAGQIGQAVPLDKDAFGDPALAKMVEQYRDGMVGLVLPTVQAHLPKILEATALAYTHEFDLAELREIRAFAQTPAGRHYLSRSLALIGDPAIAEVNTAYMREVQALGATKQAEFREQVRTYFKAHPEAARKVFEASQG